MSVTERVAERSLRTARERAEAEVRTLVEAGLAVLRRSGAAGLTVADVLSEAGLSTRAFYRHFASKDELVLAVYEHENHRTQARLAPVLDAAPNPHAAFEAWVDQTLALAYEPRRARRAQTLWKEAVRLHESFPSELDAIAEGVLAPLVAILERGRADGTFPLARPTADARSVHAVVWDLVERRLRGDSTITLAEARAHVMRFCLAPLGTRR